MAKVTCEAMVPYSNSTMRTYPCENKFSIKITVDAGFPYDILCCKKHVRKMCIDVFNDGFGFMVFQKMKYDGVDTFVPYPLHNITNLPAGMIPRYDDASHQYIVIPAQHVLVPDVPEIEQAQPAQHAQPAQPAPPAQPVVLNLTPVLQTDTQHPCCVCFDDTDQVFCSSNRHVLCYTCFNGHVVAESHRPEFNGTIKCPLNRMNECDCQGFSVSFIAKHTDDASFEEFDRKRYDVKEKQSMVKFQEDFEKKLVLEQKMTQTQKDKRYVLEHIFTLKCPHCSTAYDDFDGCTAVKCSTCLKFFCGKCNLKCNGSDHAHRHSSQCYFGGAPGGYFIAKSAVRKCENVIRKNRLSKFLMGKQNRKEILQALNKDMRDLNLVL